MCHICYAEIARNEIKCKIRKLTSSKYRLSRCTDYVLYFAYDGQVATFSNKFCY